MSNYIFVIVAYEIASLIILIDFLGSVKSSRWSFSQFKTQWSSGPIWGLSWIIIAQILLPVGLIGILLFAKNKIKKKLKRLVKA